MHDEVDALHVERNTLSGDELLSYIGYPVDSSEPSFLFVRTDGNRRVYLTWGPLVSL
jgi:hypothetical protein